MVLHMVTLFYISVHTSILDLEGVFLSQGVVRIHLVEAQNLAAKDNYVKGVMAGLSDPYAILRVGPQTFTSKHIDNTDSPKWGEMYEVSRIESFMESVKCMISTLHLQVLKDSLSFTFALEITYICCVLRDLSVTVLRIFIHSQGHSVHTYPSVSPCHILMCVWYIRL